MTSEKMILDEEKDSKTAPTAENTHTKSRADRRSGVDRRNPHAAAYEKKERRSGAERRSGVDRRRPF